MPKRRLPIGIQTFRRIREEGYYYVDKTGYARRLADEAGTHFFLSRPRRFGKSLFVDTLKELFEGNEALFRGLAVHDGWDWSRRHPVVRLDFSGGNFRKGGLLDESATAQLEDIGRRTGGGTGGGSPPVRFRRLIEALHESAGRRVVVMVDEYDKPILDALDEPDTAKANRDDLRGLYGTIKACDAHVELTFITGVAEREELTETGLGSTARCCGRRRHRQANSVRVCSPTSRRVASLRPRSAGLTALTPAPRTARPDWLLPTMLTHTPPTCCGRRPVQNDALSGDR